MSKHQSLSKRVNPLGCDVADAMHMCRERLGGTLPLALTREEITEMLVNLANTDEKGNILTLSASSKRFAFERFMDILIKTSVFKSGYQLYEKRTAYPVVPVTKYFFDHIYDDAARDCLDAMTELDIQQSLPKCPSLPRDNDRNLIEGAELSGKIHGVVIFPPNAQALLLKAWGGFLTAGYEGSQNRVISTLENMRPGSPYVKKLRVLRGEFRVGTRRVLRRFPASQRMLLIENKKS